MRVKCMCKVAMTSLELVPSWRSNLAENKSGSKV